MSTDVSSSAWFSYSCEGKTVRINLEKPQIVFGRSSGCDVTLSLKGLSRRHFRVECHQDEWSIEDLSSSYGTFVNGQRIGRLTLTEGDKVTVGPHGLVAASFEFHTPGANSDDGSVVIDDNGDPPSVNAAINVLDIHGNLVGGVVRGDSRYVRGDSVGVQPESMPLTARPNLDSRALVDLFSQMGEALLSSASLDEMLVHVLDVTFDFLPAQRGSICLYDDQSDTIQPKAARRGPSRVPINISRKVTDEVLKQKRAILGNDLGDDSRFGASESIANLNIKSVLCAPMYHNGRVLGFVYLDTVSKEGKFVPPFDEQHLEMLTAIAGIAAAGVERAKLQEEIQREQRVRMQAHNRIHVLLEVAKSLSSELNTAALIQMIMQRARELLDAERCALFLLDVERQELWSKVADGTEEIRVPLGKGIAAHVATTGEVLNIEDAYEDERFNPEIDRRTGFHTKSILCMPLRNNEGKIIGVTQMINKKGNGIFVFEDEEMLGAFSAQAAVALENAQLFQQTLEMRNYLQSVLKSITNVVLTLDDSGRLATTNRPVEPILGVPEDYMRRHPYSEWFNGANPSFVQDVAKVYREPKPIFVPEYDFRVGTRTVSTNYSVVPLLDFEQTQTGVVVVLDDITQEKRMKATLGRYMSPALAAQILQEDKARLGGVRQRVSILFSDIRGYTTFTETRDASEVVEMLNEYFAYMIDAVDAEQGVLDKFIGDAIMALFGVPFPKDDDAIRACRTALRMRDQLRLFNEHRARTGAVAIDIGVGINTGMVISGNIGSEKRLEYTCIGDGVNLASRLEGVTKIYGVMILVSEFTHAYVQDQFVFRELDLLRVKGKHQSIRLYELLGRTEADVNPRLFPVLPDFQAALDAYRRQDWEAATLGFTKVYEAANDSASKVFLERCARLSQLPPQENWSGVWEMTEK